MARPNKCDSFEERYWSRVDKTGDCWLWGGKLGPTGYGAAMFDGKTKRVHRISWEKAFGDIPAGLAVCHRCDVRNCVRPEHLFLGTHAENMADCSRKGRISRAPNPANQGSRNKLAKLTEASAASIRRRRAAGASLRELAAEFGVGETTVCAVTRGRTWRHVS